MVLCTLLSWCLADGNVQGRRKRWACRFYFFSFLIFNFFIYKNIVIGNLLDWVLSLTVSIIIYTQIY